MYKLFKKRKKNLTPYITRPNIVKNNNNLSPYYNRQAWYYIDFCTKYYYTKMYKMFVLLLFIQLGFILNKLSSQNLGHVLRRHLKITWYKLRFSLFLVVNRCWYSTALFAQIPHQLVLLYTKLHSWATDIGTKTTSSRLRSQCRSEQHTYVQYISISTKTLTNQWKSEIGDGACQCTACVVRAIQFS